MFDIVSVISASISVLGALAAFLLFLSSRRTRLDQWAQSLQEFHRFFWTYAPFRQVRAWIAHDEAYEEIRTVLAKRVAGETINKASYEMLEAIDQLAALLCALRLIPPHVGKHSSARCRLFDEYWLKAINNDNRPEFLQYMQQFYPELVIDE